MAELIPVADSSEPPTPELGVHDAVLAVSEEGDLMFIKMPPGMRAYFQWERGHFDANEYAKVPHGPLPGAGVYLCKVEYGFTTRYDNAEGDTIWGLDLDDWITVTELRKAWTP